MLLKSTVPTDAEVKSGVKAMYVFGETLLGIRKSQRHEPWEIRKQIRRVSALRVTSYLRRSTFCMTSYPPQPDPRMTSRGFSRATVDENKRHLASEARKATATVPRCC